MSEVDAATEKYFKKLDNRREKYLKAAKHNPAAYRRHIRLMAAIVIIIPMAFLLAITGFLAFDIAAMFNESRDAVFGIGPKVALALVVFSLLNAVMMTSHRPEGVEISAQQAPDLFALIEDVRQRVDGPAIDHLFISSDLNACITQPKKKFKFWQCENHLTLGLPLLNMLNSEETKAVIAHEFGHFCAGDGKLGNMLYRASMTIGRLEEQYETEGATLFEIPLSFFVEHFGARFVDRIFPLVREQEYAADAMAANVTSPQTLASALIRLQIGANYLGRVYWPAVTKSMFQCESPNTRPIQDNAAALCNVSSWDQSARWINAGLLEETDYEDTHPVLGKRLRALNITPFHPQSHNKPAAHLLGALYPQLSKQMDDDWQVKNCEIWSAHHNQGKDMQTRYQDLLQSSQSAPLSLEETLELTEISSRVFDPSTLYANINYLTQQHAQASEAWLYAGHQLLEDGQPQCIDYLKHAADLNADVLSTVHSLMAQHYREMGNREALQGIAV